MRSTDWANPACLVWGSKQCKILKYVHRNTSLQHWWVPAAWCSQIKLYTVVLSHPSRARAYEEKLSRKRGSPSSRVNGKNSWPVCPSQKYSHMLRLSRLERVDPAGRTKVFARRNVGRSGGWPYLQKRMNQRLGRSPFWPSQLFFTFTRFARFLSL